MFNKVGYLKNISHLDRLHSKFISLFIYFSAGLTLEINIEQLDYVSVLSQEAGIRVFIGGQREMPFPYEQGISVSPGFSTAIELRKVNAKQ